MEISVRPQFLSEKVVELLRGVSIINCRSKTYIVPELEKLFHDRLGISSNTIMVQSICDELLATLDL